MTNYFFKATPSRSGFFFNNNTEAFVFLDKIIIFVDKFFT